MLYHWAARLWGARRFTRWLRRLVIAKECFTEALIVDYTRVRRMKVRRIDEDTWELRCPHCTRVHSFQFITHDKFVQDGDFEDEFEISSGILWPQWVCKNSNCPVGEKPVTLVME